MIKWVKLDISELEAMAAEVEAAGGVLKPSKFWDGFAARNTATLRNDGLDSFKRSVNYNYFQWVVNSPRQPAFRSVIRAWARRPSIGALRAACASTTSMGPPEGAGSTSAQVPALGHAVYVGMLWEVARRGFRQHVADRLAEPELGRPILVRWRGKRVTEDLANSLIEYGGIAEHVPEHRLQRATVLEIGAGYGRFADLVLTAHPEARVVIVDIPPALALSQAYLTACHRRRSGASLSRRDVGCGSGAVGRRVTVGVPHSEPVRRDGPDRRRTSVVNVSSLHEMRADQIAEYLRLIDQHARGGFFYTKQWARWRNPVDDVQTDRRSYPYPATWRCLFDRTPVAQPAFFEALFAL